MKAFALVALVVAISSCRGLREPDDVVIPEYHPSIQDSLREELRVDMPQGPDIQYIAWSVDDKKALCPWTASLGEAESKRREWADKHPTLTFTVLWRQHPAPTGGVLLVPTKND
jgi:hypothetical protein